MSIVLCSMNLEIDENRRKHSTKIVASRLSKIEGMHRTIANSAESSSFERYIERSSVYVHYAQFDECDKPDLMVLEDVQRDLGIVRRDNGGV